MPIPALAPVGPTSAICLGCGNPMRLEVEKFKNGKVARLMMYCDTCKYGHEPSMDHVRGTVAKYVPPEKVGSFLGPKENPIKEQTTQAKEQTQESLPGLPGGKAG